MKKPRRTVTMSACTIVRTSLIQLPHFDVVAGMSGMAMADELKYCSDLWCWMVSATLQCLLIWSSGITISWFAFLCIFYLAYA